MRRNTFSVGWVKSADRSELMKLQIEHAKQMNPQIEMYGCTEPTFFSISGNEEDAHDS